MSASPLAPEDWQKFLEGIVARSPRASASVLELLGDLFAEKLSEIVIATLGDGEKKIKSARVKQSILRVEGKYFVGRSRNKS